MLTIYALTADRAELLAHRATVDDLEAARLLAGLYAARGFKVRICTEGPTGRDQVIEEIAA